MIYTRGILIRAHFLMVTQDILQALPGLSSTDQLKIAETALQLLQQNHQTLTREQRRQQMSIAATAAIEDYSTSNTLTIFTTLDREDFRTEK